MPSNTSGAMDTNLKGRTGGASPSSAPAVRVHSGRRDWTMHLDARGPGVVCKEPRFLT